MERCHRFDPGSIPGCRTFLIRSPLSSNRQPSPCQKSYLRACLEHQISLHQEQLGAKPKKGSCSLMMASHSLSKDQLSERKERYHHQIGEQVRDNQMRRLQETVAEYVREQRIRTVSDLQAQQQQAIRDKQCHFLERWSRSQDRRPFLRNPRQLQKKRLAIQFSQCRDRSLLGQPSDPKSPLLRGKKCDFSGRQMQPLLQVQIKQNERRRRFTRFKKESERWAVEESQADFEADERLRKEAAQLSKNLYRSVLDEQVRQKTQSAHERKTVRKLQIQQSKEQQKKNQHFHNPILNPISLPRVNPLVMRQIGLFQL